MGILWERDIEIAQNEDYFQFWAYANGTLASNTPFDFTGSTALFIISETSSQNSAQLLALTTNGGSGVAFGTRVVSGVTLASIEVTIPNAQTVALPAGEWFYAIIVITGGKQTFYAAGSCVVTPTGTT